MDDPMLDCRHLLTGEQHGGLSGNYLPVLLKDHPVPEIGVGGKLFRRIPGDRHASGAMGSGNRSVASLTLLKDVTYTGVLNVDTGDFTASGSMTIQTGASTTVSNTRTLHVVGTFTNDGSVTNNGVITVGP